MLDSGYSFNVDDDKINELFNSIELKNAGKELTKEDVKKGFEMLKKENPGLMDSISKRYDIPEKE